MKNRFWAILALISTVPLLFSGATFGFIGMSYYMDNAEYIKFIQGHYNNSFIAIIGLVSMISISIILTVMIGIAHNGNKLDTLDQTITDYNKAKEDLQRAKQKYADALLTK